MTPHHTEHIPELPDGWTTRAPDGDDVARLAEIRAQLHREFRGSGKPDLPGVEAEVVGVGSWTRRQLVALNPQGYLQAWVSVHDRAAGRVMPQVAVSLDAPQADEVAAALYAWVELVAADVAAGRNLEMTQLDASSDDADERSKRWLTAAGYSHVRTWLQMSRPVSPDEGAAGGVPGPRPGVVVRRVAEHQTDAGEGMPVAEDLQIVHQVLEWSFADHFNSYRESFPEFVQRLREDPGHRWDHWWIAEVTPGDSSDPFPGGALVSSVLSADDDGKAGSYIDYIGVHREARGRGVAKALLHTVIADAADRGRNRVGLEVDADSPTGADGLYESMGWVTKYRTESWHKDIASAEGLADDPRP